MEAISPGVSYHPDMIFVQRFTQPDFQAKSFTPQTTFFSQIYSVNASTINCLGIFLVINGNQQSAQVPHIIIHCLYDRERYITTSKFHHNFIWKNSSPSPSGWTTIIRLSSKPNSIFSVILQPWWICLSLLFALSSMLKEPHFERQYI